MNRLNPQRRDVVFVLIFCYNNELEVQFSLSFEENNRLLCRFVNYGGISVRNNSFHIQPCYIRGDSVLMFQTFRKQPQQKNKLKM